MVQTEASEGRPTRLSRTIQLVLLVLLLASFASGFVLWRGASAGEKGDPQSLFSSEVQARENSSLMAVARAIHGALNPLLCVAFGWLWRAHMMGGWRMRANIKSGLPLAILFGGLILTGMLIYYPEVIDGTKNPKVREQLSRLHLWFGLALPAVLMGHLLGAWRWAKKVSKAN